MTQDQAFIPWTRSEMGLSSFDSARDDLLGANVPQEVQNEIWEALGDSPIGASLRCIFYLARLFSSSSSPIPNPNICPQVAGFPAYLTWNLGGQTKYPKGTNRECPRNVPCSWSLILSLRLHAIFGHVYA